MYKYLGRGVMCLKLLLFFQSVNAALGECRLDFPV
uniref:Uncharacterized protein n=1 Tax=Anguilla anguilla TaxID=7936 RepID=A0A0E9VIJ3_ANGAN